MPKKSPKKSDSRLIGVMQLPFVTSRTGPMKRLVADLHMVARDLDRVRNAVARAWLRWHEDHRDWRPPQITNQRGEPVFGDDGKPMLMTIMCPFVVAEDGSPGEFEQIDTGKKRKINRRKSDGAEGTSFRSYLYHIGRQVAPHIAAKLIDAVCGEVIENLSTNVMHHHKGHKYRWQAILANDEQLPTFVGRTIPIPTASAQFCYDGRSAGGIGNGDVSRWGKSSAVIGFSLFSRDFSRKITMQIASLKVGSLSPGDRQVLRRVASQEWKWCSSRLVFKDDHWQINFIYEPPGHNLGLNQDNVAVLWPQFEKPERPFYLESKCAHKPWYCGIGDWLADEFNKLDSRRQRVKQRLKDANSATRGHGKKHIFNKLKQCAGDTHNKQRHFTWSLIDEVVRFCRKYNCGTVLYHEPTPGSRKYLWLAKRGVPYDWTALASNLSHKLRYYGIKLEVVRVNGKDLSDRFGEKRIKVAKSDGQPQSRFAQLVK